MRLRYRDGLSPGAGAGVGRSDPAFEDLRHGSHLLWAADGPGNRAGQSLVSHGTAASSSGIRGKFRAGGRIRTRVALQTLIPYRARTISSAGFQLRRRTSPPAGTRRDRTESPASPPDSWQ